MEILVLGSWQPEIAQLYAEQCLQLGKCLADRKLDLLTGGGLGVSRLVSSAYKEAGGNLYTVMLPRLEERVRVGEELGSRPDVMIQTDRDYPERNCAMVRRAGGIIALPGRYGTLTEVLLAINDYLKPVAVLDTGTTAAWLHSLAVEDGVFFSNNIEELVAHASSQKVRSGV